MRGERGRHCLGRGSAGMCDVCPDIDDEIAHTTKDYCDICHRETEQRPKDLIKEMQSRKLHSDTR